MKKYSRLTLAMLALYVLTTGVIARATGTTVDRTATINGIQLHYLLYSPSHPASPAPLFVALHGCLETAQNFADGTRLNDLAEKNGFYVVYPDQTYTNNNLKCWNFFNPENQRRGAGEAGWIAGVTQNVITELGIDSSRVYIAGMSAGAAMAANLLACYPDLYMGGLLHSGLEAGVAANSTDAQTAMSNGPADTVAQSVQTAYACSPTHPHSLRVVIFHGKSDTTVNPVNATRELQQFTGVNHLIQPQATVNAATSQITQAQGQDSASVTDENFTIQSSSSDLVKLITVDNMSHAWSGGSSVGSYTDPKGVDASTIGVNFLLGL
jgi:poly(hydroxyalkanoate) depolymerase family esterase